MSKLFATAVALAGVVAVSFVGSGGAANDHAAAAVCPAAVVGFAHCHALVSVDAHGNPSASISPSGLSPGTIKSVYGFTTSAAAGAGKTIAIVDAYDDPTAEADLGVFSSQYGLPACTTANGCFAKVNQTGGTSYPRKDAGWALEISLDVQWAHAIAPGAKILLVEASSNSFANLLAAEDYAKTHAQYVSNSWGASEFSGESSYDSRFAQSGVSFFVSSGDAGLPAEYPSASPNVISVGGTTLHFSGGTSPRRPAGRAGVAAARPMRPRPRRSLRLVGTARSVAPASAPRPTSLLTPTRPRACRSTTACATRGSKAGSRSAERVPPRRCGRAVPLSRARS
jgi:Predicted protease